MKDLTLYRPLCGVISGWAMCFIGLMQKLMDGFSVDGYILPKHCVHNFLLHTTTFSTNGVHNYYSYHNSLQSAVGGGWLTEG
ncbi:hypothetical protein GDO81_030238 [Engystomops pustulosus]|uniref:Uncharacterized protein n=1 Tax=Engystomops pustulosus TaxID=76066 RepID=A0AAV6YF83_ENGPU|nr:hypothetical protein GDO81_030238 [Engystomops pustulosus]